MRQRITLLAVFSLSVTLFCLITPVKAFDFNVYYFETDQFVYEVGETIDMVASILADYEEGGWCNASFTIVTDVGTVHHETYSIAPSETSQEITSTYLILPNETSPSDGIETAYVIFNAEIYDTYSETYSETIEVNITRSPLTISPITNLSVEYGNNATLGFNIVCSNNASITYAQENISLIIQDSNYSAIMTNESITNLEGDVLLFWNMTDTKPGTYNLTLTSNGTTAFLPSQSSFDFIVEAATATVEILDYDSSVYGPVSLGLHPNNVTITAQHLDGNGAPLNGGYIEWATSFGSGNMSFIESGIYEVDIPFNCEPGEYQVNLTARKELFQNAITSIKVTVLKRDMDIYIKTSYLVAGTASNIDVQITDSASNSFLELLQVNITLEINGTFMDGNTVTNQSGYASYNFDIPAYSWGDSEVFVFVASSTFHSNASQSETLPILFHPIIDSELLQDSLIDSDIKLLVELTSPLGDPVSNQLMYVMNNTNDIIFQGHTNSLGNIILTWYIPAHSQLGPQNFTLVILQNISYYIAQTDIKFQVDINCPLYVTIEQTDAIFLRNDTNTIIIRMDSPRIGDTLNISFTDMNQEFKNSVIITQNTTTQITIPLPLETSLGIHIINISISNSYYLIQNITSFEVNVISHGYAEIIDTIAFFSESINITMNLLNDQGVSIQEANITLLDEYHTPISTGYNLELNQSIVLPLSSIVTPGLHNLTLNVKASGVESLELAIITIIWIRTSMNVTIETTLGGTIIPTTEYSDSQDLVSTSSISSGSISSPPPILFNGTTSTESETTRNTSLTSCPRLSSGTNNLSTDSEKDLTSLSGNGQTVLSLSDLIFGFAWVSIISSLTDRDTLPKEITPHSASFGPVISMSVRISLASVIFFDNRRIRAS